jgi:hypothetical protein
MVEFDRVFEQLKKDSTGVLKDRVAEIARDAIPVERR